MNTSMVNRALAILLAVHATASIAQESPASAPAQAPDLNAVVLKTQDEVAQLRALPFKAAVPAEMQSQEGFAQYLDGRIDATLPEAKNKYYGAIVKQLGLYRGDLADFRATAKAVMGSQAGAYYDPEAGKFYVLMQNMPQQLAQMLYAHELYHGLQDQYFGLEKYLSMKPGGAPALDADQTTARSAVVEGEATYIMSMYMMKQMARQEPTREMMVPVVRMQSQMDMQSLKAMLKQPQVSQAVGGSIGEAIAATDNIPSFIMESMMGVYLKGLGFVFDVHERGWSEVEKLYTEYPPQSTEQILHPEKWRAREAPSAITFPSLASVSALKQWEQLDSDVVGEFQWRVIFREQGLRDDADAASAGWDGDRYVIFKRKDSDATLMLLSTSWDSAAQAEEFANAYRRLLANKYSAAQQPTRVVQKKENVFIVEGGNESDIDALLKVVAKTRKTKA